MIEDRIEIIKGDITKLTVDAIVNAANSTLLGGGGVDGAIHAAGGTSILEECKMIIKDIGSCAAGQAVLTGGGNLPARFVIHTVGTVWQDGKQGEARILRNCYQNSLKIAAEKKFDSIAFPNISTGVYHYPKDEASAISVNTIIDFLLENEFPKKVILCCFDMENYSWSLYYLESYLKSQS